MVLSPTETVTEVGEQLVKHPPQYLIWSGVREWKEKLHMKQVY